MMDRTSNKKILMAVEKYELNSAAYTEDVVRGVMDNLLTKAAKITKKAESGTKFISHCPKNFKCNLLVRENRE